MHFINPEVLENDRWKYGGYSLTPPTILLWAQEWNKHAESYPEIHSKCVSKRDAHIRVYLDSGEYEARLVPEGVAFIFRGSLLFEV